MALKDIIANPEIILNVLPSFYTVAALLPILFTVYLYLRPVAVNPKGAPPLLNEDWPIIGTLRFFTGRWDFYREAIRHLHSFSFHVGQKHVIGLSGEQGRKFFLESRELDFEGGYAALFSGSPNPPSSADQKDLPEGGTAAFGDPRWFTNRIHSLLQGGTIRRGIPQMVSDVRSNLDAIAADPRGFTDPFKTIYRIIYQLTMRTVACCEVANDPELLERTLRLFEEVEEASTPTNVMYPWLPTPAKFKRLWGGAQLYMIFQGIVDNRKKNGHPEDDALKFLMDCGDDVSSIIRFVIGSLFAGQLNSGINAAWILIYLSQNAEWQARARAEVESVSTKYDPDTSRSLIERLSSIPADAWESEFPVLEYCLKDSIRLQLPGTMFRKNTTGRPIKIAASGSNSGSSKSGKDNSFIIPPGSHVVYHTADTHLNPEIFPEPLRWDPGRYLPERAEDKRQLYAYIGFGQGRHPCPGQRFAKLESNMITAFFLAYFDFEYCDGQGRTEGVRPPDINTNAFSAHRPEQDCCLKYEMREK